MAPKQEKLTPPHNELPKKWSDFVVVLVVAVVRVTATDFLFFSVFSPIVLHSFSVLTAAKQLGIDCMRFVSVTTQTPIRIRIGLLCVKFDKRSYAAVRHKHGSAAYVLYIVLIASMEKRWQIASRVRWLRWTWHLVDSIFIATGRWLPLVLRLFSI